MTRPCGGPSTMAARHAAPTAGIDTARVDAEHWPRTLAGIDRGRSRCIEPDDDFFERYRELVDARARRIPLQHLTATAAFGPVTLAVGPGVFIPRPETEALLEWALAQPLAAAPVIVDLCTGSGALALALADAPAGRAGRRRRRLRRGAGLCATQRRAGTGVELRRGRRHRPPALLDRPGRRRSTSWSPTRPTFPTAPQLEPEVAEHDPAHALFGGPDGMAVIAPIVALGGPAAAARRARRRRARRHHRGARPSQSSRRTGRSPRSRRDARSRPAGPGS